MNHFIEYVCRGVIRSEDAIKRLSSSVRTLARCNHNLAIIAISLGVADIFMLSIMAEHEKDIKALKKTIADLTDKDKAQNTTEEQKEQEGA